MNGAERLLLREEETGGKTLPPLSLPASKRRSSFLGSSGGGGGRHELPALILTVAPSLLLATNAALCPDGGKSELKAEADT